LLAATIRRTADLTGPSSAVIAEAVVIEILTIVNDFPELTEKNHHAKIN
jgi:hypothetical protein